MTLAVKCPKCGALGKAPNETEGKKGRCGKCGDVHEIRRLELVVPAGDKIVHLDLGKLNPRGTTMKSKCPWCEQTAIVEDPKFGTYLKCPHCRGHLRIPGLFRLRMPDKTAWKDSRMQVISGLVYLIVSLIVAGIVGIIAADAVALVLGTGFFMFLCFAIGFPAFTLVENMRRCDDWEIEYYSKGKPRDFRASL